MDINDRFEEECRIQEIYSPYLGIDLTLVEIEEIKKLESLGQKYKKETINLLSHILNIKTLEQTEKVERFVEYLTHFAECNLSIQQLLIKKYVQDNFAEKEIDDEWDK